MAEYTCHNCVYAVVDAGVWLRWLWEGLSIVPRCANAPWSPGRLCEVPGVPCRNYRPRPPIPQGENVRMIPLGDGCYAYVDAADYEWLSQWNWHVCNGYAGRSEKGRMILMHREIMRPPRGMVVDHIDGSKANNCRFNLRNCTREQNMHNKRKQACSCSIFKGVYRDKRTGKWGARCRYKGKSHGLGYFGDDEIAAARAYDRQAIEWFGEYARPNFPNEWPPQRRAEVRAAYEAQLAKEKDAEGTVPRTKRKTPAAQRKTNSKRATGHRPRATAPNAPKRKTRNAKRTTKSPRAETPGRGGRKRKTRSQPAAGSPSDRKSSVVDSRSKGSRTTETKSHAGTPGRRVGKRKTKNPPRKTRKPPGPGRQRGSP